MATKKKEAPLTIVAAYRRLNEILGEYRDQIEDTPGTVAKLDGLSRECLIACLPLKISISEEDLDETGINPTPDPSEESYDSIEPESSESSW